LTINVNYMKHMIELNHVVQRSK